MCGWLSVTEGGWDELCANVNLSNDDNVFCAEIGEVGKVRESTWTFSEKSKESDPFFVSYCIVIVLSLASRRRNTGIGRYVGLERASWSPLQCTCMSGGKEEISPRALALPCEVFVVNEKYQERDDYVKRSKLEQGARHGKNCLPLNFVQNSVRIAKHVLSSSAPSAGWLPTGRVVRLLGS